MIIEAMTYIDRINNLNEKLKFLDTLRRVTEGKVSFWGDYFRKNNFTYIYLDISRDRARQDYNGACKHQGESRRYSRGPKTPL